MNAVNELLQNLIKLQSLQFSGSDDKKTEAAMTTLRAKIPSQILAHYDRIVVKGKKGITLVRDQVCTGCHMRVPIGAIMSLKHGEDIQLCESCGRYLYLAPETEAVPAAPAASPKPVKKTRKSKKSVLVV
jgi:predicted  nucleic acid-binding Zn-ribbon protein